MNERVSFEIKRKSPPAPPFSSLHQSQLYPLSPQLSFIITARDFIPALEAAGRPVTARSARERKRGRRGDGRRGKRVPRAGRRERERERRGTEKKGEEEFVFANFFPPFDIVSLYLVRLPYFYFSPYGEQPVLDIFLRRVLSRGLLTYRCGNSAERRERTEEHKG